MQHHISFVFCLIFLNHYHNDRLSKLCAVCIQSLINLLDFLLCSHFSNTILVFSSVTSIMKVSLTVLLLFGGAVNPVVLIGSPNHFKLVKEYLKLPRIWNEWVDVRFTVAGPVLDQICRSQQEVVNRRMDFRHISYR